MVSKVKLFVFSVKILFALFLIIIIMVSLLKIVQLTSENVSLFLSTMCIHCNIVHL